MSMRILYGVCGEGFGHSSRAKEIITYLEKRGHIVKVITYGQAYPILKEEGFDVFRVEGLHIIFHESRLQVLETIKHSFLNMSKNIKSIGPLKKIMQTFKPEICISDMEPLVPILSFWYQLPLVSIDNQHRITHLQLHVPQKYYKDYLIAKLIIHKIVARADWYIVTSFTRARPVKKHTLIVPPILRKEVVMLKKARKEKDTILVYLTKPEQKIIDVLHRFHEHFVVYGSGKEGKEKNVVFKMTGKGFLHDLRDCKAIVATSGFTLMSEALYLQKPYFALPLQGQFEQVLNALFLKQSGYGDYADTFLGLERKLQRFFSGIPIYRKKLKRYHPDNTKIFKALDYVLRCLSKRRKNQL